MKKTNQILIILVTMLGFTHPQTLPNNATMSIYHQALNSRAHRLNSSALPTDTMNDDWVIECVDCPKLFFAMTNHNIQLDANDHPHIAYGEDHLYYAWYNGTSWHYEAVDDSPSTGSMASLVRDNAGFAHISYVSKAGENNMLIKYASQEAVGWNIHTVYQGDGDIIGLALDIDGEGYPHIGYVTRYYTNGDLVKSLRYAFMDTNGWHYEMVSPVEGDVAFPSIAVDMNGIMHISYNSAGSLIYAIRDGSGWEYKMVDSQGYNPSMVLDNNGYPQIAYFNMNSAESWETEELRYAFQDDSGWYSETVEIDNMVDAGWGVSLALGSDNQPFMSVCSGFDRDLNLIFVYRESGTWKTQIVDTKARFSSIAMDSQGRPHIVYHHDIDPGELKYATLGTFGWQLQIVDREGFIQGNAPLALDDLGKAHINYIKYSRESCGGMYAYLSETGWIIHDGNPYGSLILDSSNTPYIFNGRTLFYLHESTWISDSIDCLQGAYDPQSSLALDSRENPHVVVTTEVCGRYTCDFGVLEYAYRQAGSWTCETIGSERGENPSLAFNKNNVPYVSYSGPGLMLAVRDESGWNVQNVDDQAGGNTSLALDQAGHAHISYHDDVTLDLKFAHQTSEGWDLQTVDSAGEIGVYNSLVLDTDGSPHISYFKSKNYWERELRYAVLEHDQWVTSIIDPLTSGPNSIAMDPLGNPHISYVDEINQDVNHAYIPPPPYAMLAIPSQNWGYGLPGELITYTMRIANSGQFTDTYTLSASDNLWTVENPTDTGQLLPYQSIVFEIQVTIPRTATLGSTDIATITLISKNDPSVTTSVTLTTYAALTTYMPLVSR